MGAGLLAKAVDQSLLGWMCRRLREQARSHKVRWRTQMLRTPETHCGIRLACESGGNANAAYTRDPVWERACPRKRWVSHFLCWMCRRLRGQAHSHRVSVAYVNAAYTSGILWERACSRWRQSGRRITCPETPPRAWPRTPPCLPSDHAWQMPHERPGARNAHLRTG